MTTKLKNASPFNPYTNIKGNSDLEYSKIIKQSYDMAMDGVSKLPQWIFEINGMSGKKYRHFINNLVENLSNPRYLEIGSWKGSTLSSAIFGNKVKSTSIDNWSQFGNVKDEFIKNIDECLNDDIIFKFYENDFRKIDYHSIGNYNLYFFDGPHEEDDHYDGISYALPSLDEVFILIIDDWNWLNVRKGTLNAIKDLNIETLYSIEIRTCDGNTITTPEIIFENSDWHNGYYISVLKKDNNNNNIKLL